MKLFVSDLDGTLLNSQQQVSKESVEILKELMNKGLNFTVATARSISSAGPIIDPLNLKLPVIVHNGVFIYDPVTKTNIISNFMENAIAKHILKAFMDRGVKPFLFTVNGACEYKIYYESIQNKGQSDYLYDRIMKGDKRFTQTEDLMGHVGEKIITLVAIDKEENLKACYESIKKMYPVYINFSEDIYTKFHWLEITHEKANKEDAVLDLKRLLKADELICFGDNLNDLPMFEVADKSLAVRNAHEDVKRAAHSIIGGNDEDGVAQFLKSTHWNME